MIDFCDLTRKVCSNPKKKLSEWGVEMTTRILLEYRAHVDDCKECARLMDNMLGTQPPRIGPAQSFENLN